MNIYTFIFSASEGAEECFSYTESGETIEEAFSKVVEKESRGNREDLGEPTEDDTRNWLLDNLDMYEISFLNRETFELTVKKTKYINYPVTKGNQLSDI